MKHEIRPMAPGELAQLYGISLKRLNRWLLPHKQKIGKRTTGYTYTVPQIRLIFDILGDPYDQIDVSE